jgi:hypothetical protein
MAEGIEKVPAEARMQISAKGLTGVVTATSNLLKDEIGEKRYNEFSRNLWFEGGKGAKEFADTFGFAANNATEINEVMGVLFPVIAGPEVTLEVVEATEDRCVGKCIKCPWHERMNEMSLNWDFCTEGHEGWSGGCVESLNPSFTFSLTKNMMRGDPYCEWVVERKK